MDTLVKFCLVGLIIGAWFSEYVAKPLIQAMGHLLSAARSYLVILGYKIEICLTRLVRTLADEAHPMLLFTLLVGLCILLAQERIEKNEQFIKQNPTVVVSNWSIIP
jgi:hypothetical protein